MTSGENWSSYFREKDILRLQDFIHVYTAGAMADNPGDKHLIVTKRVCCFEHRFKFQPLVFNTF